MRIDLDLLARERQAPLSAAQLDMGVGHIGAHHHPSGVGVGLGRLKVGPGGLGLPAQTTEQVKLP